jgi:hypothetical protein
MPERQDSMKDVIIEALVNKIKNEVINELGVSGGRDEEGNFLIAVTSKVQDYLILKLAEARFELGLEKKKSLDDW